MNGWMRAVSGSSMRCRPKSRGKPYLSFKVSSLRGLSCCLTALMREATMVESTLWVAHIEDTEGSRAVGLRMIVGTKLLRS